MDDTTSLLQGVAAGVRGALAVALVDYVSRFMLAGVHTGRGPNLEKAADADTDVVRAKLAALELLGYHPARMEDIVVTLDDELHVIRPLNQRRHQGLFLYLVLDRRSADLARARAKLCEAELRLDV
ncbi:hypothetical protein [Streptomyces boninensis]|uniref:hypothetical protein n=1 Tax=Streptomyces boninensis TaxID=2039455 RepID=UPI003B20DAC1